MSETEEDTRDQEDVSDTIDPEGYVNVEGTRYSTPPPTFEYPDSSCIYDEVPTRD